ncbi:DNA cytosine methyltransferase [Streptomyces werraensis]|uniref:DNA cytosine methyltransferase n=1 Tax=Streptomyces werraensis TaxID=68284 RepID=UPI0034367013
MLVTMTDLFCGAGGSTCGALQIPGVRVVMAANHSRHAINTHQHNHPTTDHDCADISQVVPTRYPRTDILWGSPECTHHTRARGKKRGHDEFDGGLFATDGTDEAAIRSRATMHDIARFAEHHRYRAIIVENVPDARWWGPEEAPGFGPGGLGVAGVWEKYRQAVRGEGAVIEPYMIELHGGGSSHRPATAPMSTLTAGGINHGVVYADPAVHDLLPYYGNSSAQPVTSPMPTLTTRDRHGLIGYAVSLEECRYRMLIPREAARAMEFPEDFVFLGDRDQTIEMIGNAVTTNAARDLVGMVVEALTGEDVSLPANSSSLPVSADPETPQAAAQPTASVPSIPAQGS